MPKRSSRALWAAFVEGGAKSDAKARKLGREEPILAARKAFIGTVLGIDPSLRGTGLAVVEALPGGRFVILHASTVRNGRDLSFTQCLGEIHLAVNQLITAHRPAAVAVEETIYVQNFRTAQILGAARGAAVGPAAAAGSSVFEYAPRRVKQAVTGRGGASKQQVAKTVASLCGIGSGLGLDETDAAAVALCHIFSAGS